MSNAESIDPERFINKGNMCYANSILQILSVAPNLWSGVPSGSNTLLPILRVISFYMAVIKNSTKSVDPSSFLLALKHKLFIGLKRQAVHHKRSTLHF